MKKTVFFIAALIFAAFAGQLAAASGWKTVKVSNKANFSLDGRKWVSIKRGSRVPRKAWVKTGIASRLKLRRGGDVLLLGPNTRLRLSTASRTHGKANIELKRGSFTMQVRKGRRNRVKATTRHLAAVVKGTTFSVSMGMFGSRVSVKNGLVGVTDTASGKSADIGAGQSASSNGFGGFSASGGATASSVGQGGNRVDEAATGARGSGTSPGSGSTGSGGTGSGTGSGSSSDDSDDGDDGAGTNGGGGGNGHGGGNGNGHGGGNGNGSGDGGDSGGDDGDDSDGDDGDDSDGDGDDGDD